jgi:beta-N-acetylhexosaminidase
VTGDRAVARRAEDAAVPAPTVDGPHSLHHVLAWLTRSPSAHAAGIGLLALLLGAVSSGPKLPGPVPSSPQTSNTPGQRSAVRWLPPLTVRTVPTVTPASYDVHDPSTWTNAALAAELTVSCVDVSDVRRARGQARAGIGGITLIGSDPDRHLGKRLRAARRAAPHHLAPFVMSDEEGGEVQRLRTKIYPLPSAKTMGGWGRHHVRRTAQKYGARMRALGVQMDLAPVADLKVKGSYIASLHRAFSHNPTKVATMARAWRLGMGDSNVATVLKHWPGHGSARNSHNGPASVPPLDTLERRDMRPFNLELARGARVVMVGHLTSKGLTEPGVPASESPAALRYLRAKAGHDVVIITDALDMAAASVSLGLKPARAAVRALRAGADWALVCSHHPSRAIAKIRAAIDSGALPRDQAVASSRRIVALKSSYGLAPR